MKLTLDQVLQKGIEAHKAGKAQEADRYYTAILKANPKHPDANHNLGVLAVGVGKVDTALPFLKTALEANPKIAQFWLSYIDALIKLERLSDAKAVFDQAKSKGAEGDGFDQLEQRLKDIQAEPLQISKTDQRKKQNPSQNQLQSLINLHGQGRLQQALKQAEALIQQFPRSVALYNIQGTVLKGLGHLDLCVEAYKKALAIKPDYVDALYNIGLALKEQGKLEAAIEAYKKALAIKPDYVNAYYNIGNVLKGQGKLEEAIEAYKKALAIKPDYVNAYYNMGNAFKQQRKLDEAIKAYNKALAIKPGNAEAYNNIGNVLKDQGKLEEAIEIYNKALAINPDYADAYHNIGNALKEQGKLEEAIEAYVKSKTQISLAKALECYYILGNFDDFDLFLNSIAIKDTTNIRVAAMSAFAAHQRQKPDPYPFCPNPIDLIKFTHIKEHISDHDNFIGSILSEMNERNAVWEPENKTTKGGFQTNENLFLQPSPKMKTLEDIIKKELIKFRTNFKKNESVLFQKWPHELKINAWYVRMFQNGHQDSHIHTSGWVSGVFYLKTVGSPIKDEGAIEFGLQGYDYPVSNEELPRHLYQPRNGDLVLFPSSLFHKTIPVIKDTERCVIAFDLVQ